MIMMGSEDISLQCQSHPVPVCIPCDSTASFGIASVPLLAHSFPMSLAQSQAATPTPVSVSASGLLHQGSMSNAASHTPPQNVTVQPSVPTVPASPLPHVQVIQQPLQSPTYLQHLYAPQQQHMFLPGNLTIQPTLQSLGGTTALSLHLQGKTIENKNGGPAIISAGPMQNAAHFSTSNLIPAGSQMLTAGTKSCLQGQMLTASTKSTAVIQGQSGFIPSTTANQTVVIGQLGVLSNQASVLPHQAKVLPDNQKNKSFLISQPATLHPKSPILPSSNISCGAPGQIISNSQLKQLSPHIINPQTPTMIASQAQILGSLQALGASLPQGITWATPAPLHSPAILGQNPIFIRSQQSDMFIQSPTPQGTLQTVPVAVSASQPNPSATVTQVQKLKQVRPASSVATQTAVSTSTATNTHIALTKTQTKPRGRSLASRTSPAPSTPVTLAQFQTATTQTQTFSPSNLKTDAANQTKPTQEAKVTTRHNKSSSTESSLLMAETNPEKSSVVKHIQPYAVQIADTAMSTSANVDIVSPLLIDSEEEQMDTAEEDTEDFETNVNGMEFEQVGVDSMPEVTIKEKHPQKAIVKPHVLTHVIEGFVIQEGSEPFPVSRSPRSPLLEKSIEADAAPSPVVEVPTAPKKKEKLPKIRGHVELAKCEFCEKLGPKSKFKRSKRFCSTSCAKRYNVGCSKRLSHAVQAGQEHPITKGSGKSAKKKKVGLKSRKGLRKANKVSDLKEPQEMPSTVEIEVSPDDIGNKEPQNIEAECENETSPTVSSVIEEPNRPDWLDLHSIALNKSPLKWTVTDVVDFVRNLPGCSDYAEEFRAEEIDGQAFLLLNEDHLISTMGMKLGPAVKVCASINILKDEVNH